MAAVALAISGDGALSSLETTVLLTVDETMDACARPSKSSTKRPARSGSRASAKAARAEIVWSRGCVVPSTKTTDES